MKAPDAAPLGLRVVRDALVVPARTATAPGVPYTFGVMDAAGAPVPEARWLHRGRDLAVAEAMAPVRRIAGRHVFAGLLLPHFGHAIVETLSRAWYLRAHPGESPLWLMRAGQPSRAALDLLDVLGLGAPATTILREPVQVEELVVPAQGCAFGGFFHSAQAAALAVRDFGPPRPAHRVWLSRSALPEGTARIEGEAILEEMLRAAGWTILAPERLSLVDQLAALAGAEEIAGFMGSAFHLLLLLDGVTARVRILDRRLPADLVRTYVEIAAAKGLRQEVLRVPTLGPPRVGPRQSIMLDRPEAVMDMLVAQGA